LVRIQPFASAEVAEWLKAPIFGIGIHITAAATFLHQFGSILPADTETAYMQC